MITRERFPIIHVVRPSVTVPPFFSSFIRDPSLHLSTFDPIAHTPASRRDALVIVSDTVVDIIFLVARAIDFRILLLTVVREIPLNIEAFEVN